MNQSRYSDAVKALPAVEINGDNPGQDFYNRHWEFVFQMEHAGQQRNQAVYSKHWTIIQGRFAGLYTYNVICLNLKEVDRLGPYGNQLFTSWRICASDIKQYMTSVDRNEESWRQSVVQELAASLGALGEYGLFLRKEFRESFVYSSPPLCIIVGRRVNESCVLLIFKEDGMWRAMLKFPQVQQEYKPSNLVFYILKQLKIGRVKIIPGALNAGADVTKENYKVCASMFDGRYLFDSWKDQYNEECFIFDVKKKQSLMKLGNGSR